MPGTLPEILQHKKVGDTWFSYIAPEEFHIWQAPWNRDVWKKYGVQMMSVGVFANETVKNTRNEIRYSRKHPLYLEKTGIEITAGVTTTKQKRSGSFKFRVDSIIEFNEAMRELVKETEIKFWQLKSIEISNSKTGGICEFRRHNPDGNGVNFYFWRLEIDKSSKLYPDINITDQEHYLGNFKQHFAACECSEALQKFHGCVLQKSSRKPIK